MMQKIKITPEGLNLMISVSSAGYTDGFYGKEVYLTDGFTGDTQHLFQALGNMGAYARDNNLTNEVSIVIVSEQILSDPFSNCYSEFIKQFEVLLNRKNTPFLRLIFMSENDLLNRIQKRGENFSDDHLKEFVRKYKASKPRKQKKKEPNLIASQTLFDF